MSKLREFLETVRHDGYDPDVEILRRMVEKAAKCLYSNRHECRCYRCLTRKDMEAEIPDE